MSNITASSAEVTCNLTNEAYVAGVQFVYFSDNGSDTKSVVATVTGNRATATLSSLQGNTTYTLYGIVTATNGTSPQSAETTFTTLNPNPLTDHTAWFELPAKIEGEGSNMLTRSFYDEKSARNYTMYYDTSTYTAYWVAYPLTAGDLGSGRPNDPWQATPGISTSDQINIWNGSYGVRVGSNYYSRGHQISNADRNRDPYGTACTQTFYATNSTPQLQNGFNGGIWNSLEGAVRSLTSSTDTVYVVTGAILQTVAGNESVTYIQPKNDSKQCPVPNYYYKVLLKVKRDASTGEITSASTVGVWLPHKEYSGTSYQSYTKSVAEIEQLTGYNFFANLPEEIQAFAEQNSSWSVFSSF